jgi:hypothetical protein
MESDFPVDTPADLDEDSETSYVSGDTLGKLWAFINQVCGHFCMHGQEHGAAPGQKH